MQTQDPAYEDTMIVRVFSGDIVAQSADAIVNTANRALRLGGGIDNAIRTAAGPEIESALAEHAQLSEGTAIVTPGFKLAAKWVIHTVAPRWEGGAQRELKMDVFRSCHRSCLEAAQACGATSIVFPAIGTGAFGWPVELAADAAMEAVNDWLEDGHATPELVSFVCPNAAFVETYDRFRQEWIGQT